MRIVLVTGAAPYLGGPLTWQPLRAAAPEFDFVEVDPLIVSGAADMERHVREAVGQALHGADGIVAHRESCRLALEAVSGARPDLAVLLLAPMMAWRKTTKLRIARAVAASPLGAWMVKTYARSQQRKLHADRSYVRRQLGLLVRPDRISDELVDEARQRLDDPRTAQAVERTAELMASVLTPLDSGIVQTVVNRRIVYGADPQSRRMAQRMSGIVLPNANGSPMIEEPAAVAAILRELLSVRT